MQFEIKAVATRLQQEIQQKIDLKTKPLGALGVLETIALQIARIQGSCTPVLENPTIIVFAGDHGIAQHNIVNPYPQAVTAQMVYNFLNGGAAINVFCKQHQIALKIVDAGVNHDFEPHEHLIAAKIGYGTQNYQEGPAMTAQQCNEAMAKGAALVNTTFLKGCNTIGFGEMGIGNTSAAALLMAAFTKIPIAACVGSGTGLSVAGIRKKTKILTQLFDAYAPNTPLEILATFGGFEIVMLVGGILQAATLGMTIMIDGFIVTAALIAAHAMHENVLDYCILTHTSGEQGHQKMLDYLDKKSILNLGMRLGEGSGIAVAFPILQASVNFLNEMASFEQAGVSTNEHV